MEFNNILDTDDIGVILHPDSSPANSLAKSWFPNIEFDKVAKKYNVRPDSIMNRAVSEKARKLGYDGIKYGDVLIQGF
jgi:trans-2-enoyl-CoA reductase